MKQQQRTKRARRARHRQPRQNRGPITRAFLEVLEALLWGFHNVRSGRCFPSFEAIAARAECNRDTVYEALKALEWAGVLTWQNRIALIQVRERDLFGRWASRWRVIRTSNAYVFRDPLARPAGVPASKSENPSGTKNQEVLDPVLAPARDPDSPLERALARFAAAVAETRARRSRHAAKYRQLAELVVPPRTSLRVLSTLATTEPARRSFGNSL